MLVILGIAGWCIKDSQGTGTNASGASAVARFHQACDEGDLPAAERIFSEGLSANTQDECGNPLLCYAAFAGHTEVINCLIQHGAKVNVRSPHGFTPLMFAAQNNHAQAVETLLFNGADRGLRTDVGLTAGDIAASNDATACMLLLAPTTKPTLPIK